MDLSQDHTVHPVACTRNEAHSQAVAVVAQKRVQHWQEGTCNPVAVGMASSRGTAEGGRARTSAEEAAGEDGERPDQAGWAASGSNAQVRDSVDTDHWEAGEDLGAAAAVAGDCNSYRRRRDGPVHWPYCRSACWRPASGTSAMRHDKRRGRARGEVCVHVMIVRKTGEGSARKVSGDGKLDKEITRLTFRPPGGRAWALVG